MLLPNSEGSTLVNSAPALVTRELHNANRITTCKISRLMTDESIERTFIQN